MLADPVMRKRYFSIVDMDELEENEFYLNIPRYVDTFEPEEEIDLVQAIEGFKATLQEERTVGELLSKLMEVVK
jgi:type I restriction enzyme M protein